MRSGNAGNELASREGLDGLVTSSFGIGGRPDEDDTLIRPNTLKHARALAIVPALAFDETGLRIGYGGGFYDTFLPSFPRHDGRTLP